MNKGKLGVRLSFYTVLAFVLAYLGYSTLLFLLAGVVFLVEKDEWAIRQVIQAICLCFLSNVVSGVLGILNGINSIPILGAIWGAMTGIISAVIGICVLIFAVLAISHNIKGEDANIPGAKKVAEWACGVLRAEE